jgi:hypothetical protein
MGDETASPSRSHRLRSQLGPHRHVQFRHPAIILLSPLPPSVPFTPFTPLRYFCKKSVARPKKPASHALVETKPPEFPNTFWTAAGSEAFTTFYVATPLSPLPTAISNSPPRPPPISSFSWLGFYENPSLFAFFHAHSWLKQNPFSHSSKFA